jgi:hypothetical protein
MNTTAIARLKIPLLVLVALSVAACASSPHEQVFEIGSAVEQRSYQSRVFDTGDRTETLRTIIAALQDLGFVIDKADATLGSITATKLDRHELRLTATVRARGDAQMLVRINASMANRMIDDPEPYQQFYAVLEKAMFLTAHEIE